VGNKPRPEGAPSGDRNSVTLGPRDRLVGQLYIEGDLRVGGTVEGEVEVTGDVDIDDEAKVTASVAGRQVSIRGQVNGAVIARTRLVVARNGSLIGDVRVARLVIQEGAKFSGNVSMGAPAEAAPKAAQAPERVDIVEPAAEAAVAEPEPAVQPAAPEMAMTSAPRVAPKAPVKSAAQGDARAAAAKSDKGKAKGKEKPKRR
jgi:cytoskeletal protein CcmA (bactofilin family)